MLNSKEKLLKNTSEVLASNLDITLFSKDPDDPNKTNKEDGIKSSKNFSIIKKKVSKKSSLTFPKC